MFICKVDFTLFSNINQSACSTHDWVMNSQSDFDWVEYKYHWGFPKKWEDKFNFNIPYWQKIHHIPQQKICAWYNSKKKWAIYGCWNTVISGRFGWIVSTNFKWQKLTAESGRFWICPLEFVQTSQWICLQWHYSNSHQLLICYAFSWSWLTNFQLGQGIWIAFWKICVH